MGKKKTKIFFKDCKLQFTCRDWRKEKNRKWTWNCTSMSSHPILTFIPYFQGIVCTFLEFIKKEVDQLQFEVLQLIFEKC